MKKSDIMASLVLGLIIGLFLAFILQGFGFGFFSPWILVLILPILAVIGIFIGEFIGKKIPIILQFVKFIMVGLANTAVDFGILNLLMATTGIYSGTKIFFLNSISFVVSVIHSYFWNKFWTFKAKKTEATKEFLQFLIVSIIGLLINGGIVYMITTWLKPMFGLKEEYWANAGKVAATAISLIWNFIGYKFIVFKKKNDQSGNLSQV
jgi:putative flippase GtrA